MDREAEHAEWLPRVTAVVPCYNAAAFIARTLDSLAAQTWPSLEIIIGDDCSSDETFRIASDFQEAQTNVQVVRRDHNVGWLKNSNDLMARATGELMFFAFHDDVLEPTYVEKLVEALRERPGAVMSFSDLEVFEADGTSAVWTFADVAGRKSRLARALAIADVTSAWWVPNRGLFRAWVFHQSGGIKPNEQGEYSADWTWLLHMSLLGEFVRVPEVLCCKFYKEGSLSKRWTRSSEQKLALRRAGIRLVIDEKIPIFEKILLISWIRSGTLRGAVRLCPTGVKVIIKRLLRWERSQEPV